MRLKSILAAAMFAATVAGGAADALAQAASCTRLEAQLATIQRSSGGEQQFRQADAAVRQAQAEYNQTMQSARQMGCLGGGFLFFRPAPAAQCGALTANLERQRVNVGRLEAQRSQFNPGAVRAERNQVLQALALNNCGPQYAQFARAAPQQQQQGGFFGLFAPQQPDWRDQDLFFDIPTVSTYRTLCVRTCDGYYFPISFSTVQGQFVRDEEICRARCPGADVALYAHRNPGQNAEQAVTAAGDRYADLPTAFAFRQAFNPSCACGAARGITADDDGNFTPVTRDEVAERLATLRSVVPIPMPRPSRTDDPETVANRAGSFVPEPVSPRSFGPEAVAGLRSEGGTRLIGPAYFYAQ